MNLVGKVGTLFGKYLTKMLFEIFIFKAIVPSRRRMLDVLKNEPDLQTH